MTSQPDVLKKIIQTKRAEVESRKTTDSIADLKARIAGLPASRGFEIRIRQNLLCHKPAVIAECKKASPSRGIIRENYDAGEIASSYEKGGAACLSVLTDESYFLGSLDHLALAKESCSLPVLRKDFMIDTYQIYESRAGGADCILLIVAALQLEQMIELGSLAIELGMDVLVEVHSYEELEQALAFPLGLVGINNRDLRTFKTELKTSVRLRKFVPENRIVVAESGIHTIEHVNQLQNAGIHAYLVGESLMRAQNPGVKLEEIFFTTQRSVATA